MLVIVVEHSNLGALSALYAETNSVQHFVVAVLVAVIWR